MGSLFVASKSLFAQGLGPPTSCRFSGTYAQEQTFPDSDNVLRSEGIVFFDCKAGIVWQMSRPSKAGKVYTLAGSHFVVDDQRGARLVEGPLQQYVGDLILQLMQFDQVALEANFHIESSEMAIVLSPRSRRLKKFLHNVVMERSKDPLSDTALDEVSVTVDQINGHSLKIVTVIDQEYGPSADGTSACLAAMDPLRTPCFLLEQYRVNTQ